jgi:hypothetical protein
MRLLEWRDDKFKLTEDLVHDIPEFAILSHTWGSDSEEVTFKDMAEGDSHAKVDYVLRGTSETRRAPILISKEAVPSLSYAMPRLLWI